MKPVVLFSMVMLLLSVIGFVTEQKVFKPVIERPLPQRQNLQVIKSMSESDRMRYYESRYNEVRSSFIPFDLANGLTFADIRAMRSNFNRGFYLLVGCLFLVRFLKKPKA